jgi:dienelactone hydrolase
MPTQMLTLVTIAWVSVATAAPVAVSVQDAAVAQQFAYDATPPIDVKDVSRREDTGTILRDITYATLTGGRNAATLITPAVRPAAPTPGILFVHWYGPPAPTSNRTQFVPDAMTLARLGVTSLLIDTPWSVPEYFKTRTRAEDFARSVQQVRDLGRALDVLAAQPALDPSRLAYVGHDFGAMYGTLAAANDHRVTHFVFMAGTASFSDWFLYGPPKLEGEERERVIKELAPLDPVRWLPRLRGPLLMQFADSDEHVSDARREMLAAAAPQGSEVRLYKAGHELNEEATRDRVAWLRRVLKVGDR